MFLCFQWTFYSETIFTNLRNNRWCVDSIKCTPVSICETNFYLRMKKCARVGGCCVKQQQQHTMHCNQLRQIVLFALRLLPFQCDFSIDHVVQINSESRNGPFEASNGKPLACFFVAQPASQLVLLAAHPPASPLTLSSLPYPRTTKVLLGTGKSTSCD